MYTAQGHIEQNTLFQQHLPLVRRIAQHMHAKLPPNVDLGDLIQAGMLGLHDALSRYQSDQGVQFESFASQRIRGAMLDELRACDWASRNARKSQKDIERALHRLEQQLGRSPAESEIAAELGMPLADYQSLLAKVQGTQLLYLEDLQASHPGSSETEGESFLDRHMADHGSNPMHLLREQRLRSALIAAIDALPERERYIMGMYYEQGMNLKEIAAVLGVTESRICQLHSQAIARLRSKMREH